MAKPNFIGYPNPTKKFLEDHGEAIYWPPGLKVGFRRVIKMLFIMPPTPPV
jgi:hypothetical protein